MSTASKVHPVLQVKPDMRKGVCLDIHFECDKAVALSIHGNELKTITVDMWARIEIEVALEGHADSICS